MNSKQIKYLGKMIQFEIQCNYAFLGSPGLVACCWESRIPFSNKKT